MSRRAYPKVTVNNPCICCSATESVLFLRTRFEQYPGPFDYRRCLQCGLVFNSPRPANLSSLYDKDYFQYHIDNGTMRRHVVSQIERLILPAMRYAPGKRLIELGAGRVTCPTHFGEMVMTCRVLKSALLPLPSRVLHSMFPCLKEPPKSILMPVIPALLTSHLPAL